MRGLVRGFVAGSLGLVILYVTVQPGAAAKTQQGSGLFVAGLRALFAPDRAGIGDHSTPGTTDALTPTAPTTGGGGGGAPKFT